MPEKTRILVTGAGGFIGHHLVTFLKSQGYWVRDLGFSVHLYYSEPSLILTKIYR